MTTVCGIDLAAGRGTTEMVVPDGIGRPLFQPADHRRIGDEEIVAAVRAAAPAVVAIDAPLSLPAPVAAALHGQPPPKGSPYLRAAERDPIWTSLGVRPLPVSFLAGLTFRAFVLRARLATALPETRIVETFPAAVLRALGITGRTEAGTRRARKTSPEARAAAQSGLRRWIAGIPEPATDLLSADLLDAPAAGLAAVAVLRGAAVAIGDAQEGQIMLPQRELLAREVGGM
jgi:predicted nuclease with RNAse H fold